MNLFPIISRSLFVVLLFASTSLLGQVINGYAQVEAITGTTLEFFEADAATQDESGDAFLVGERAILMQMKDYAVPIANLDPLASCHGCVSSPPENAGKFEVVTITGITRDALNANRLLTITVASITGTYMLPDADTRVQLITFNKLTGTNPSLGATTALSWNRAGGIGGVIAIEASGTLTLTGTISAAGAGYRGGPRDGNTATGVCDAVTLVSDSSSGAYGAKGEGIHIVTAPTLLAARGRMANGGGGGNTHNGGGGGGGNHTAGGGGGIGWNNADPNFGCGPSAGGAGGEALSAFVGADRVFMGGGGGAGEQNNNVSTRGGHGGGIIFILADKITTSCAGSISINANGESLGLNGGNDAGSGGGAGGAVYLQVSTYDIPVGCPLAITANGGNGGSVNNTAPHGGGGGGGAGSVLLSVANPTVAEPQLSLSAGPGTGGKNDTDGFGLPGVPLSPANADNGGGTNVSGLVFGINAILPVSLLSFEASQADQTIQLNWTALEQGDLTYSLEKYTNNEWIALSQHDGLGGNQIPVSYQAVDASPVTGYNHYRLRQHGMDGQQTVAGVTEAFFRPSAIRSSLVVIPNPNQGVFKVVLLNNESIESVKIFDATGRMLIFPAEPGFSQMEIKTDGLAAGVYTLHVVAQTGTLTSTFVIIP